MTLRDIDPNLNLDLLLLTLKAQRVGWEAYPPTLAPEIEAGFSEVLMWWEIGEKAGIHWK